MLSKHYSSEHCLPLLVSEDTDEDASTSSHAASDSAGREYSPPTPGPSGSPSLTVITSSGNWNWNWDDVPSASMGYHPHPPPPYPGGMFYPPYPGYSEYGCSPLADVTNYSPYAMSFPYPDCLTSSSQPPNNDATVSCRPFVVKFLNGRIKVCAGCKGPHLKGVNNELLPLPMIFVFYIWSHSNTSILVQALSRVRLVMLITTLTVLASEGSTPTSHQASYPAQRRMSSACKHLTYSFCMMLLCSFNGHGILTSLFIIIEYLNTIHLMYHTIIIIILVINTD